MSQPSEGIVVVGSKTSNFYTIAINFIESILDYWPEAKITLFTEEQFVDHRADVCDNVFFCDDHYRAKLYGMANTPYDITLYVDADMVCEHEDVQTAFDLLGDHDMVFTPLSKDNEAVYASRYFTEAKDEDYSFKLHGAVCLYDNRNPLVNEFMQDWWTYYCKQFDGQWWPTKEDGVTPDYDKYPKSLGKWDQFTLWWLVNKEPKYKDLDIGLIKEWARWNWACTYNEYNIPADQFKDPIFLHMSSACNKWGESFKDMGIDL